MNRLARLFGVVLVTAVTALLAAMEWSRRLKAGTRSWMASEKRA